MINGLTCVKDDHGGVEFMHAECGAIADRATGAQNKDELPWLMICSKCGTPLGEWPTETAREEELEAFAERTKREI